MPIYRKTDQKGSFYRYGDTGKKYYYITGNSKSRQIAYNKALKQGQAIKISQNKYNK